MKIRFAIISNKEQELISSIEEHHKDDSTLWKLPNLIIPIVTILLAMLCYLAFSNKRFEIINYFNLIFNGSLPLIAINQISSTGIHIFKYDKNQEDRFGKNTFMLRTKLFWYSLAVLVLGVLLFAFQVITNPFSSWILLVIMLLISFSLIYFSSYVSKRVYLLQDNFIEKTFDIQLREEAQSIHGHKWD